MASSNDETSSDDELTQDTNELDIIRALKQVNPYLYVDHDKYAGVVKILIDQEWWYVRNVFEPRKFGKIFIKSAFKKYITTNNAELSLYYDDGSVCLVDLSLDKVEIRGKIYCKSRAKTYIGHLINCSYISYVSKWVLDDSFPYLVEKLEDIIEDLKKMDFDIKRSDVLNEDFTPANPMLLDIINADHKLVVAELPCFKIKTFTLFGHEKYIIDGLYSRRFYECGVFKYENDNGEIFICAIDPKTGEASLVNEEKNIKLNKIESYILACEDGLYDGFKINYHNMAELCYDYDEITGKKTPIIYRFDYTFFAFIRMPYRLVILDARKPDSGQKTKAAI